MNKFFYMGNVTKKPELLNAESGKKYTFLSVAINGKIKTTYIGALAFGKLAEWLCNYFYAGKPILCIAHIEGGEKENDFKTTTIIDEAFFCGDKGNTSTKANTDVAGTGAASTDFASQCFVGTDEHLPF